MLRLFPAIAVVPFPVPVPVPVPYCSLSLFIKTAHNQQQIELWMRFVDAKTISFSFRATFRQPQPTVRLAAPSQPPATPSSNTYRKSFRDTGIEVELAARRSSRCCQLLLPLSVIWLYLFQPSSTARPASSWPAIHSHFLFILPFSILHTYIMGESFSHSSTLPFLHVYSMFCFALQTYILCHCLRLCLCLCLCSRTPVNLAQSLAQSLPLSSLFFPSPPPLLPLCSSALPYFTIISAKALRTADCHSL